MHGVNDDQYDTTLREDDWLTANDGQKEAWLRCGDTRIAFERCESTNQNSVDGEGLKNV